MPSVTVRKTGYQDPCNKLGMITSSQISHADRKEPARNIPLTRTTIYDEKPLEYVMPNPLPIHDQFLSTTKDVYHRRKYYDGKYAQPYQPIAPSLEKVLYVKPDWAHKMKTKHYHPKPINDTSETKAAFKARHPMADMYGGPVPSDPVRSVFVPAGRDYVVEFNRDEPAAIRTAHPYFPTSRYYHRHFSPEELADHATMNRIFNDKGTDVAIKLRIRPMEGPFAQRVYLDNREGNSDVKRECPAPTDYSHRKHFFSRPLYQGCPPRVFQPVPRLGWAPLTQESYGWPYHCFNKENHTSAFSMCRIQPKHTYAEARKVPWMYTTESQTYGSGKPVSTFMGIHSGEIKELASNILGEDCGLQSTSTH